jgi:hypothetical protein
MPQELQAYESFYKSSVYLLRPFLGALNALPFSAHNRASGGQRSDLKLSNTYLPHPCPINHPISCLLIGCFFTHSSNKSSLPGTGNSMVGKLDMVPALIAYLLV